ncbi:MAG: ATP-binding cassette domain-containing protein [Planctomycetota bacterium]|nr:MAG: ATP-binding cassette domain-containing protein [Planctomycetota bacterium]
MLYLQCAGLTRRPWFEGFELELEEREIIVLAGPSGSGKTTLLRAIADLDPVDSGEVFLRGAERMTMAPSEYRSKVIYMHQTPVRLAGTVRDNVAAITGLGVHDSRAPDTPPGLGADQDANQLSGGEAQRLALHRALLVDPDVLLLDEPTAALDPDAARGLEATIQDWVRAGHAALWVAHDPELAGRLGARMVRFP